MCLHYELAISRSRFSSVLIILMSWQLVWTIASSAKKFEEQYLNISGKSLMNNKNKTVLIEAFGTPDLNREKEDVPVSLSIVCRQNSR